MVTDPRTWLLDYSPTRPEGDPMHRCAHCRQSIPKGSWNRLDAGMQLARNDGTRLRVPHDVDLCSDACFLAWLTQHGVAA